MVAYCRCQVCAVRTRLHRRVWIGGRGWSVFPKAAGESGTSTVRERPIRTRLTSNVTGHHCKARKFPLVRTLTQPSLEKHLTGHLSTDEDDSEEDQPGSPFPQARPAEAKGAHPLWSQGEKAGGQFLSVMSPSQVSSQLPVSPGGFSAVSWGVYPRQQPLTASLRWLKSVASDLASAFQAHLRGTTFPSKVLPVVSYCLIIIPI